MSDKNSLERLTFCVDTKLRRIYWGNIDDEDGEDFSWNTVEATIRAINALAAINKKPIELHMSSGGGDTSEMLRLHDVIQSCPCQIKFYGGGTIASAATWIMACCDERYLYPNTQVMLHKWSGSVSGSDIDHRIDMQVGIELTETLNKIYEENSKMPASFWNEITHRDLYISAEEAITLGIADKIIPFKKRGNLRRARIAIMNKDTDPAEMRKLVKKLGKRVHLPKTLKIDIQVPKEEYDPNVMIEKEEEESKTTIPEPTIKLP